MKLQGSSSVRGTGERGNRTHQDRLIKALRRQNIATTAHANRYLDTTYLDDHNTRFASLENLPDVHRPCHGYDLTNIFCFQTERQVHNDYTITLEGTYVQLKRSEAPLPPPRHYVTVRRWLDGSLHIFWKELELAFSVLKTKPRSNVPRLVPPSPDHPWRHIRLGRNRNQRSGVTPVALRAPSVTPHNT